MYMYIYIYIYIYMTSPPPLFAPPFHRPSPYAIPGRTAWGGVCPLNPYVCRVIGSRVEGSGFRG